MSFFELTDPRAKSDCVEKLVQTHISAESVERRAGRWTKIPIVIIELKDAPKKRPEHQNTKRTNQTEHQNTRRFYKKAVPYFSVHKPRCSSKQSRLLEGTTVSVLVSPPLKRRRGANMHFC